MIDYNKLKQAHELAYQCSKQSEAFNVVVSYVGNDEPSFWLDGSLIKDKNFDSLDELIECLEELLPRTKYKVGDTVWRLSDEYTPVTLLIASIDTEGYISYFDASGDAWLEQQLYPTKDALIDDMLEYWSTMKAESHDFAEPYSGTVTNEGTKCKHESDGICYTSYPSQNRCQKCGEFYK